jgi:hypothetical protein
MKKLKMVLVASLIVLLAGCSTETIEPPTPPPAKNLKELGDQLDNLPKGTSVKMLFVLEVKSGTVKKTGDGKRELTFKTSDVSSVLGFTDRPQRHAFNLTVPALTAIWGAGKNSFAKDPPNAIIKDSRSRIGVTEVTGFVVDGDEVTVSLDRMAYKTVDKGDSLDGDVEGLTLFIDSKFLGLKITGAGIAFGLQQAAKACVSVDCELWPLGA